MGANQRTTAGRQLPAIASANGRDTKTGWQGRAHARHTHGNRPPDPAGPASDSYSYL
ncbi:MAG: hypothetical protein AB1489_32985 [Acidobacteriota bacterium]